ncbi:MAG: MFS transporter [Kofleriaceae bacterium]|nr:MFS transporter [Kofleriaceae bacterium]
MLSLLRRSPAFGRLWAAGAVSLVGDWLSFVAVAALALTTGGGPLGLALVFAAHALPGALLAPIAGGLVDGLDRRRVLIGADVAASLVTLGMATAAVAGAYWLITPLLLVRSAIAALVPPGESAAVRRLVGEADLLTANGILAATWSVSFVAGMALGGFAALLGPTLALALDAASFAVAAAIHATLPPIPSPAARRSVAAIVRAVPADTAAALRVAGRDRALLSAVLGKTPLGLAGGAAWVELNLLGELARPFGAAALSFGILQAIRGAGTGIGPAIAARLARGGARERTMQIAAVWIALVAIGALTVARSPVVLSLVCLTWGIGTGSNWVLAHSSLQRNASDAVIGRLAAFDELLVTLGMVVSAFVGAAAMTMFGSATGPLVGVALGVAGLAAARALELRTPQRSDVAPAAEKRQAA